MAGFDIAGARAAGYSDAEIAAHLAKEGSSSFDFSGATKAGYTPGEILNHLDPQPSGVMAGLAHGLMGVPEGISNTASVYGGDGDTAAPSDPNYKPAQIIPQGGHWYDPTSYNWKQVPQAVAEMAPGMATDIAAAKTGQSVGGAVGGIPGRLIGGALGGVGSYLLRTRGDIAKQDAQIRSGDENAVPNSEDKTRALLTGAAESVPQMVGVGRFLQGPAKAGQSALARLATTTATEAGTGAAQNAIQQGGATIGTPGGMQIDPNQVASAGVVGGATGGALGVPRLLTDVHTSHVFRHIDANEELAPAASAFANRIQDAAGGRNLSNPTVGGDAFTKARQGVHSELSDAVKGIQNPLGPDAENVLNFIKSGKSPTEADYSTLKAGLGNDPQAANVLSLAHQAHVSNLVEDTGHLGDNSFTGGLGNKVAQMSGLSGHSAGKAVIGTLLAEHLGSHLITYNPASLGLVAGAYGLTRLMDNLSGARSPANRFAQRYADPGAPTRFTPTPQQPPQGDQAGPTGPKIPLAPTPWGPEAPVAPQAPAPIDPLNLPRDITVPAKNLISGIMAAKKAKADYLGTSAANSEVQNSPFISQLVGGAQNVPTPEAARAMSKAVSGARVLSRLQSDPAADAEAKVAAKAAAQASGPAAVRIQKKSGSEKVEQKYQPDEGAYQPIPKDMLRNAGMSPAAIAERDTQGYPNRIKQKYYNKIDQSQSVRAKVLTDLSVEHPQDEVVIGELKQQLHDHSQPRVAIKAINHYLKMMSPQGAAATKAALLDGDFIARVWGNR